MLSVLFMENHIYFQCVSCPNISPSHQTTRRWCTIHRQPHLFSVRRVPPHFSTPLDDIEVMPGGAVNLTCIAVGSPMPYVKWRIGTVELTPQDDIPIGKNVLMLTDVRETATYTCEAASALGNIEAEAQVKVKGTPNTDYGLCSLTYWHFEIKHIYFVILSCCNVFIVNYNVLVVCSLVSLACCWCNKSINEAF